MRNGKITFRSGRVGTVGEETKGKKEEVVPSVVSIMESNQLS